LREEHTVTLEENKALVRRFVQEVWGEGNLDVIDELVAPDFCVYYPLMRETVHGPEAFKQVITRIHAGLSDVECVSEDVIAEGDQVVVRWTLRGTHAGEIQGVPPTGKQLALTGIGIYRLADGKIAEERGEEDALGYLRQLGVIPAMG
jgi:steroid delta-isomerase-like uncharacterized protein